MNSKIFLHNLRMLLQQLAADTDNNRCINKAFAVAQHAGASLLRTQNIRTGNQCCVCFTAHQRVHACRNAQGNKVYSVRLQALFIQCSHQNLVQNRALRTGNLLALQVSRSFDRRILHHNVEGLRRTAINAHNLYINAIRRCQNRTRAA